jgi:hypothetical protein
MGVYFSHPDFLWLLFLIPLLIFVYFFSLGVNKKRTFVFGNFEALSRFYNIDFFSKNFFALYFFVLIVFFFVFGLAGFSYSYVGNADSYSHLLMVDISDSMAVLDIFPNRLSFSKNLMKEFVDAFPLGTEFGVLAFSGETFLISNLTNSKILTKMSINEVDFKGAKGTNLYSALITARNVFEGVDKKSIVLFTDGQFNALDSENLYSFIKANDFVVHGFLIGSEFGGESELGFTSVPNEEFLKAMTFNSGGVFQKVDSSSYVLDYQNFLNLSQKQINLNLSLYCYFIALFLICFYWILFCFKMRIFPC